MANMYKKRRIESVIPGKDKATAYSSSNDDVDLAELSEADLGDSEIEEATEDEDSEDDHDVLEDEKDEDSKQEQMLRRGLAEIPFEALIQAQTVIASSGGNARSKDAVVGKKNVKDHAQTTRNRPSTVDKSKKASKSAPMELSSKKPVSRHREAVEVHKIDRRDPRFDPESGRTDTERVVRSRYAFLDDYRKDEMQLLNKQIRSEKDPIAKAKLEKTLNSMQSREQAAQEKERRQHVLSEHKRKEALAAKEGKIPYHLKATERNKLYLKDKFDAMKDSKSVDKYIEKKRKRRSQKDRKRTLPS